MLDFPNIDPVALDLKVIQVRWYSLAYLAGILLGIWLAKVLVARERLWNGNPVLSPDSITDVATVVFLAAVLGGRLGFAIFYQPAYFLNDPLALIAFWRGGIAGMSFHGGFVGAIIGVIWCARSRGVSFISLADLATAVAPIGLFFGRIANFINGELWGRHSDVAWAMVFPRAGDLPRHPSQLYEAMLEGAVLLVVVQYFIWNRKALAYPGRITGIFVLGYGLARSVVENFREPDFFLGYFLEYLTMGILLSLPMIALGALLVIRSFQTPQPT